MSTPDTSKILNYVTDLRKEVKRFQKKRDYQRYNPEDFKQKMREMFKDLAEDFPGIFDKTIKGEFENPNELRKLHMMLNMVNKVKNNDISEHDASVAVGQHLVDEYVKPQLDGVPPTKKPDQSKDSDSDSSDSDSD